MKVVVIGGEPATGKSTLVRRLLESLNETPEPFKDGIIVGQKYPENRVLVIGKYEDGEMFGGTDRLSMAAAPKAIEFIESFGDSYEGDWTILFEGDRLFTEGILLECIPFAADEHQYFILTASEEEKHSRHESRGDSQTAQFLTSRKTKISRLREMLELDPLYNLRVLDNTTPESGDANFQTIRAVVSG